MTEIRSVGDHASEAANAAVGAAPQKLLDAEQEGWAWHSSSETV